MRRGAVLIALSLVSACELRPAPKQQEPAAKPGEPQETVAATDAAPGPGSGSGSAVTGPTGAGTGTGSGSGSADAVTGAGSGSGSSAGSAAQGAAIPPPPPPKPDARLLRACQKTAAHVVDLLIAASPKDNQAQLKKERDRHVARTADGCVQGHWSEEGRKCLNKATDRAGIEACQTLLQGG